MKIFKVKPAEKFALEFEQGEKIIMCFNTKALSFLAEQINEKKILLAGPEFMAAIIYAGAKACDEEFTIEKANALYVKLEESSAEALNGILQMYYESSGIDGNEVKKNLIRTLLK